MSADPLADLDQQIFDFLASCRVPREQVQLQSSPQPEFGERSFAVFGLAKSMRRSPQQIAEDFVQAFRPDQYPLIADVQVANKGFVNFFVNYATFAPHVIQSVRASGATFGRRNTAKGEAVVVEHTSVNPNKEWHIGHVRNAVLGDVVARLLSHIGDDVQVQNYIDDTGLQCAQAIDALVRFPESEAPNEKFDHYVGRLYVKIAAELGAERQLQEQMAKLDAVSEPGIQDAGIGFDERETITARLENVQRLQQGVLATMHALERGEYHHLVERILNAQLETAYRLGVFYDLLNWESHLVQSRCLDEAIERLQQSPAVFRAQRGRYEGAMVIQTADPKPGDEDPKAEVLIRRNGIPTYVGKDIAYHMWKFGLMPDRLRYSHYAYEPNGRELFSTALEGEDWPPHHPDRVINVIAVNQSQAQATVKAALDVAGYSEEARDLFHLAYGLVTTREGKISGRKGTNVAADAVIQQAVDTAYERVSERRSADLEDSEMRAIAEAVGVGAVRYFMVQNNPQRDIVFDVADVVSYDGNTGLYVQYALVRMFAILRRAREEHGIEADVIAEADTTLLQHEQERRLLYQIAQYPDTLATAARTLGVNLVTEYAFDLATIFNQFYRDCGVLNADPPVRAARLLLVQTVRDVLRNACSLLGVPVIEKL